MLGITVTADVQPAALDVKSEHALLRIAQEALSNAARHSSATLITMLLLETPPVVGRCGSGSASMATHDVSANHDGAHAVVPSVDHVSTLKRSRHRRGHEREREPEGSALTFSAAQANSAVMLLDDRAADK